MSSSAFHSPVRSAVVGLLALALSGIPSPRPAFAQRPAPSEGSPWRAALGGGASFFWGPEGNTVGYLIESGLLRHIRNSSISLRGDVMYHHYDAQSLGGCLVSTDDRCFPLMQRSIGGIAIGAQYALRQPTAASSAAPYLLGGLATYVSTRVATSPAVCSPSEVCTSESRRRTMNDIDYGVQIGAGTSWPVGRRELYVESKYHHRFIRANRDDPYTSFRFSPITVGMRF